MRSFLTATEQSCLPIVATYVLHSYCESLLVSPPRAKLVTRRWLYHVSELCNVSQVMVWALSWIITYYVRYGQLVPIDVTARWSQLI